LDFTALRSGSDTLPLDGDAAANRQLLSSTQPIAWAPGEYLVLRWFVDYYFGRTQAMIAIDDLKSSATAVLEPSTYGLLLFAAILGVYIACRRCRNS
jgi:hypothetical protein